MEHHKLGVIATHKVASHASCILGQAENVCRGCFGQFSEKKVPHMASFRYVQALMY